MCLLASVGVCYGALLTLLCTSIVGWPGDLSDISRVCNKGCIRCCNGCSIRPKDTIIPPTPIPKMPIMYQTTLEVPTVGGLHIAVTGPIASSQFATGSIHSDLTHAEAEQFAHTIAKAYLCSTDYTTPSHCIDGRACARHLDGTNTHEVGPAVAGGATTTAYAGAELAGLFAADTAASTLERVAYVDTLLEAAGIALGGHVVESALPTLHTATGAPQTGCGASDRFADIIRKQAEQHKVVCATVASLLGDAYQEQALNFVAIDAFAEQLRGYNATEVIEAVAEHATKNKGHNVEVLTGSHGEELVVFNFVPNTTVNRDALVGDTGRQAFIIDVWYIHELAHALAMGRPDAEQMFQKLLHAMLAFQIAAYLTLCDGSHCAAILAP